MNAYWVVSEIEDGEIERSVLTNIARFGKVLGIMPQFVVNRQIFLVANL